MSRPFRAQSGGTFVPRALPWAGMSCPVGAAHGGGHRFPGRCPGLVCPAPLGRRMVADIVSLHDTRRELGLFQRRPGSAKRHGEVSGAAVAETGTTASQVAHRPRAATFQAPRRPRQATRQRPPRCATDPGTMAHGAQIGSARWYAATGRSRSTAYADRAGALDSRRARTQIRQALRDPGSVSGAQCTGSSARVQEGTRSWHSGTRFAASSSM